MTPRTHIDLRPNPSTKKYCNDFVSIAFDNNLYEILNSVKGNGFLVWTLEALFHCFINNLTLNVYFKYEIQA